MKKFILVLFKKDFMNKYPVSFFIKSLFLISISFCHIILQYIDQFKAYLDKYIHKLNSLNYLLYYWKNKLYCVFMKTRVSPNHDHYRYHLLNSLSSYFFKKFYLTSYSCFINLLKLYICSIIYCIIWNYCQPYLRLITVIDSLKTRRIELWSVASYYIIIFHQCTYP